MHVPKWWHQIVIAISDKTHPIWTIAGIVTVAGMGLGYTNATTFDGGEITTALGTGASAGASAWLINRLRGR